MSMCHNACMEIRQQFAFFLPLEVLGIELRTSGLLDRFLYPPSFWPKGEF